MNHFKLFLIATMMVVSQLASAGYTQPAPVQVTLNGDGSGSASGDMVTARTDKTKIKDTETGEKYEPTSIGCGLKVFSPSYFATPEHYWYGFCQATNELGEGGSCFTEDRELLDALKSSAANTYLRFDWDVDGECTRIDVSTQSFYIGSEVKENK